MDPLQTKVIIPDPPVTISYKSRCLFMGSCFSDYIGTIMAGYKFRLLMNPFGTLFNPASIAGNLENLVNGKIYKAADLNFHDGLWLSFDHYTGFSNSDPAACLAGINRSVSHASEWLRDCDFLILTFGTAWIYRYKESGKIVANCHKIPQAAFLREFMEPTAIIEQYHRIINLLRQYNPKLKLIFTLSPVRHWSDGAVNNQLSKAVLHFSIHEILKRHEQAWYFPSYEIFMDELRDYRFYASDMLHPSEQGARYVWERFRDSWVDAPSRQILAEVEGILKATGHRPVNPGSEAHRKFRQNILKKTAQLVQKYPFLDFSEEIDILNEI